MAVLTLIIFFYGAYLIYACIEMKRTGTIPKMLVNNKINLDRAKDIPGYIKYMFSRSLIFGLFLCVFSALLIAAEYVSFNPIFLLIVQVIYITGIIIYTMMTVKATRQYLL